METLKRLLEIAFLLFVLSKIFDRFPPQWKKFLQKIGTFQGKLLLTVFYFTLLAPFGLFVKIFQDSLHLKKPVSDSSHWKMRKEEKSGELLEKARNL